MKLKMPIGIEDFKTVRENCYFVDKTDFIRQIIENQSAVTLITRPRRFGKTLTMSMLNYFLSNRYKNKNPNLFKGLAIEQSDFDYTAHKNAYPTIFLTLRNVRKDTLDGTVSRIKDIMSDVYISFEELQNSNLLNEQDKAYFNSIINKTADQDTVELSLLKLTQFLYKYYNKKVLLLLDEYDVPIQQSWEYNFYDKGILFMKNFLGSALKSNPYLDFAVLTGVLRIAKESIFSDLNNLDVCSVLKNKYSSICGFTQNEVEQMANDLGKADKLDEIKKWYNGYLFGNTKIYNPWSVINYFDNDCKAMPYWVNTSENTIIQEILPHATTRRIRELKTLLDGKSIRVTINEGVVYTGIWKSDSALYTMLLTTGYLTVDKQIDSFGTRYALHIPNNELSYVYSADILNSVALGLERNAFDNLKDDLLSGRVEDFEDGLQQILVDLVSSYDTANKESFYHGLLLGMTAMFMDKSYIIESNRESGYGRFDLAIFPKNPNKYGVIMEFKVAESIDLLENRAHEALKQIEDKLYITEFQKRNILKVWKYGIAFYGKRIKIVKA